jgi:hypothetical protein
LPVPPGDAQAIRANDGTRLFHNRAERFFFMALSLLLAFWQLLGAEVEKSSEDGQDLPPRTEDE